MTSITPLLLVFLINGYEVKTEDKPVYVWPLSLDTNLTEIMSSASEGKIGVISYETGAIDHEINSAIGFTGEENSFVELAVPEHDVFLDDYSILFYLYVKTISVSTRTLLHYTSDITEADDIEQFKISILNRNILVEIIDFGSVIFTTNIRAGVWNHIIFKRNFSKNTIKLYLNRTELAELNVDNNLHGKPTNSPGILHLGGHNNNENRFTGRLSCLQILPCTCKHVADLKYDSYCRTGNIMTLSQSTGTRPTSDKTVSTTTTTESTKTTTGTTSVTIAMFASTPASTTGSTIASSPHSIQNFNVEERCSHFTLILENATFSNPTDVILSIKVGNIGACSRLCNIYTTCFSFAMLPIADGYECKIGPNLPNVSDHEGSMLYQRR